MPIPAFIGHCGFLSIVVSILLSFDPQLDVQVGCGVGNTTFPILQSNPKAFVHASDFSPTAIQCLKCHEEYNDKKIQAFVADITSDKLTTWVSEQSVDICTMIFVLSAISPDKMEQANCRSL